MAENQSFLSKAAGIAGDVSSLISPVGGIVSAVKGIGSLLGLGGKSDEELMREQAELQYKYQTKLNEQQQQFARENAETEYSRQRELTADQFTLEKQGKRAAGMSTVMGDGSHLGAASVPSIATPNAGSAAMADANIGTDRQYKLMQESIGASSLLKDIALSHSQKANLDADTSGKELENQFNADTYVTRMQQEINKYESGELKNAMQSMLNQFTAKYGDDKAKAERDASVADALYKEAMSMDVHSLNFAQIRYYENMFELMKEQKAWTKKQVDNFDSFLRKLKSETYNNFMQGLKASVDAAGRSIQNESDRIDLDRRIKNKDLEDDTYRKMAEFANWSVEKRMSILDSQEKRAWFDSQPKNIREKAQEYISNPSNANKAALIGAAGLEFVGILLGSISLGVKI